MTSLKIYYKPNNFELPNNYQRIEIGENNQGFVSCKELESDRPEYRKYRFVLFYEGNDITLPFPGEEDLEDRPYPAPKYYNHFVYFSDEEGLIYCVGNKINLLHHHLINHSNVNSLDFRDIDLDRLFIAVQRGLLRLMGHSCKANRGTLSVRKRKIDGLPFVQNDPNIEIQEGDLLDCLELQIEVEGKMKSFYIYEDGLITFKGKTFAGTDGFITLRNVYTDILNFI